MILELTGAFNNHGSVTMLEGLNDEGEAVWFGADARPAHDLIDAVMNSDETVEVYVEGWQIL